MNAMVNHFQEFNDEWDSNEMSELIDVSKIDKVPMTFIVGTNDAICPWPTAKKFIKLIKAPTKTITVVNDGHMYFSSRANTEWFMDHMRNELQVPAESLLQ